MPKKPTKPTLRISDPRKIFDHATRFWVTDLYVLRSEELPIEFLKTVIPPSMVISAFASELFLKCILLIEKQEVPDTHHLATLYRRIGHKRKRRIEQVWELYGRPRLKKVAELRQLQGEYAPTDLPNSLAACSDAFKRLRYAYEKDYSGVKFWLGDLPMTLRDVILEDFPDWGVQSILTTSRAH